MNQSHRNLGSTLSGLDVPLPVSEVHGLCCGLLCSMSSAAAKTRWFTEVLDTASLTADSVSQKAAELKQLDEWFSVTLASINDTDLDFYPCLPEEDSPVKFRLQALSDFCSGFTYGIGLSGAARGNKPLPADTREIIDDFQAIDAIDDLHTSAESGDVTDSDSNTQESMYNELLEYVRVGVLLVLEELRPVTPVKQELPS